MARGRAVVCSRSGDASRPGCVVIGSSGLCGVPPLVPVPSKGDSEPVAEVSRSVRECH